MEKNIKEIKETIKADFVNSRAIIKNYETSDGTIYMTKTIELMRRKFLNFNKNFQRQKASR